MTMAPEAPAASGLPRLTLTDDPATALGDGQRIIFAESAAGEVMLIVDNRTCRLGLDEKFILLNMPTGPMLVIVDADEIFFGPDPRDDIRPVTDEAD